MDFVGFTVCGATGPETDGLDEGPVELCGDRPPFGVEPLLASTAKDGFRMGEDFLKEVPLFGDSFPWE